LSYTGEWIWAPVVMGVVVFLWAPSFALRGRHDASISELAEALAGCPAGIRRAVRRLQTRGLVRQRHAGRTEQTLLEITPAAPDTAKAPVR
jgi:hypothetical protein